MRYFVAVAEELNFRKAAQRLHISRPALSKQIKDLEDEISVKLLLRDTKSVKLTKAGELFLSDSLGLLANVEHAVSRAKEAEAGHRGELRVGSAGIISSDFLPKTLRAFRTKYPDVEVTFIDEFPAEQLEALAAGKIDIAFAYGDEGNGLSPLNSLCVVRSLYGLAVSHQHPLASRESIELREIKTRNFLSVGVGGRSPHGTAISRIFTEEGFPGITHRPTNGFDSLITLLAADQGISLLPVALDLRKQNIAIIPIEAESASLDFKMWAVWKEHIGSLHIQRFIRLLEGAAASHITI